jgi:hypothetical protein
MTYNNIFEKPIGEKLDINDLQSLIDRKVAEGFYVEYKSDFVKSNKIARSIASFANTYGGWYFIGIKEANRENIAEEICGFDHTKYNDPLAKITDPIRQWVSHMPLMYPQLIELDSTRSVIAVYIPEGNETPYITGDGKIYRRAADSSDPIYETNRYSVDRLVDRGEKEKERFTDFCQDDRTFSQSEDNPWISIYLQPQPRGLLKIPPMENLDDFEKLLQKTRQPTILRQSNAPGEEDWTSNIPFDTIHKLGESTILRQTSLSQIPLNTLTMQLFGDGAAKIHIPLSEINPTEVSSVFTSPLVVHTISDMWQNDWETTSLLRFVDAGRAIASGWILSAFYITWLKENDWQTEIWHRVSLDNGWRIVPIIDSDSWGTLVEKIGLPVSPLGAVSVPDLKDDAFAIDYSESKSLHWRVLQDVMKCLCLDSIKEIVHMFSEEIFKHQDATPRK